MTRFLQAAATALLLTTTAASAAELTVDDLTEKELERANMFMTYAVLYDLYHEMGHMLISQLDIPMTAKEEDAVDNLATLELLAENTTEANQAIAATAHVYLWTGENPAELDDSDFMDVHSLNKQRAFSTVCLAVGGKPKVFAPLAREFGMPDEDAEGCGADYEQAKNGWEKLLEPYKRPDDEPPAKFRISYEDPTDDSDAYVADFLKSIELLEIASADMPYSLPDGITMRMSSCDGTENAWWSQSENEIVYCYPLARSYLDLILADIAKKRDTETPANADEDSGAEEDTGADDSGE